MSILSAYRNKKIKQKELLKIPYCMELNMQDVCPDYMLIVESDLQTLMTFRDRKTYSIFQIVLSFCYTAYEAHKRTNCITECLFDDALSQANEMDKCDKKLMLKGIPFSCKDTFDVKGIDTSMGYGNRCQKPAQQTSAIVQGFMDMGAILICKTNVPQSLFATECSNNVFGYTTNPYHKDYSPGGSSGAEAALLKCNGAAFGIGSDIAGSIRFPSGYCGIYGLKMTQSRSITHSMPLLKGNVLIYVVAGPMARSSKDLQILFQYLASPFFFKLDLKTSPLSFTPIPHDKTIKVGYFMDTDFIRSSPASYRAVFEAINKLKHKGIECKAIKINNAGDMFSNAMKIYTIDGAKSLLNTNGDMLEKWLYSFFFLIIMPDFLIKILLFIASFYKDPTVSIFLENFYTKSVQEIEDCALKRIKHIDSYLDIMTKNDLDVMICPIASNPAHKTNQFDKCAFGNYYSVLTSYLDMPVVAHPITHVKPTDKWVDTPTTIGEQLLKKNYDPSIPLPVGIQIIGLPYQEEMALHVSRLLDTIEEGVKR